MKCLYNWVIHWAGTPYGVLALFILSFAESSFFPIPPDVLLIALCLGLPKRWAWFAGVCTVGSVAGAWLGYGIGFFLSDSLGEMLMQFIGKLFVHGGPHMGESFRELASAIQGLAGQNADFGLMAEQLQQVGETLRRSPAYELSTPDKALWLRAVALSWFNCPQPELGNMVLGPWAIGVAGFTPIPYKVFTIAAGMFEMSLVPFTIASVISRGARFFAVAGIIGLTYRFFGDRLKNFIDKYFNLLCVVFTVLLVGGFVILKYLK